MVKAVGELTKFIPVGTLITDTSGIPSDLKGLKEGIDEVDSKKGESQNDIIS